MPWSIAGFHTGKKSRRPSRGQFQPVVRFPFCLSLPFSLVTACSLSLSFQPWCNRLWLTWLKAPTNSSERWMTPMTEPWRRLGNGVARELWVSFCYSSVSVSNILGPGCHSASSLYFAHYFGEEIGLNACSIGLGREVCRTFVHLPTHVRDSSVVGTGNWHFNNQSDNIHMAQIYNEVLSTSQCHK